MGGRIERSGKIKGALPLEKWPANTIEVYKRFKNLIERWIVLAIEHSQVKMKQ